MSTVSGRVLANYKEGRDKNWLIIASMQYGRIPVKAVLSDKEAEGISVGNYVQLSGKPWKRNRTTENGTVVKQILITKPVVERILRTKKV